MKQDIHPDHVETKVHCTCGNTFTTHSTSKRGALSADMCFECRPFYTGKQGIPDTDGHVACLKRMYAKNKKR